MWVSSSFGPIGNATTPFAGTFDGNSGSGYTIDKLTINAPAGYNSYVGLFGSSSGSISNVTLTNVNVTGGEGGQYIGGLAGANSGSISASSVSGNVSGGIGSSNIGGLVGWNQRRHHQREPRLGSVVRRQRQLQHRRARGVERYGWQRQRQLRQRNGRRRSPLQLRLLRYRRTGGAE